jgi:protein-tyrosine phosphatase
MSRSTFGVMTDDRHLDWDGCANVRDLGGLPAADGRETRWGAVVRADAVDRLTAAGWSALQAHGIRTVIDLRNEDELEPDVAPRPDDLTTVHVPLDGVEDTEFWDRWAGGPQFGTPLYYRPFLDRFPQRAAGVIAEIAHARPGGVLVHCGMGRDRTGLVTLLVLALVGVAPEAIAADYALSADRLRTLSTRLGEEDQGPLIEEFLARENTSAPALIISTLTSLQVDDHLRKGGLGDRDLAEASVIASDAAAVDRCERTSWWSLAERRCCG